jgi:hypothetical protein
VKLDKFHSSKVQNQEGEDQGGDQRILALSTTFVCRLLPQNISRGRSRTLTLNTGLRTSRETADDMEDDEVIFDREKGPKRKLPPSPQYRSRWMRRQQTGHRRWPPTPPTWSSRWRGSTWLKNARRSCSRKSCVDIVGKSSSRSSWKKAHGRGAKNWLLPGMRMVARVAEVIQL